eukprot:COSAG05_NODE_687_length_7922_cov_7.188035_11_plen_186_part_00
MLERLAAAEAGLAERLGLEPPPPPPAYTPQLEDDRLGGGSDSGSNASSNYPPPPDDDWLASGEGEGEGEACTQVSGQVPEVFSAILGRLEELGALTAHGIFRLSAGKGEVDALCDIVTDPRDPDPCGAVMECKDVHVPTAFAPSPLLLNKTRLCLTLAQSSVLELAGSCQFRPRADLSVTAQSRQ